MVGSRTPPRPSRACAVRTAPRVLRRSRPVSAPGRRASPSYDSNSAAVHQTPDPTNHHAPDTLTSARHAPRACARGTAEARAPAAAHVTVAAPVAENGASPLVAPLSSPPVSRVSIYSCTAVSVTLNHTRHLLLSARLSLAARLCVRASQAGRWSRVAAGGWLEVEVAISPVHL